MAEKMKKKRHEDESQILQVDNNMSAERSEDGMTTMEETPVSGNESDEVGMYKAKSEEYLSLLQRVQADFDNFRRRTTQEREDWAKYSSMRLITSFLPILDNFERALHAAGDDLDRFKEGVELIHRQLKEVLEKDGVRVMETVGCEFDPNMHEAVMQGTSDEHPDNIVIEEFQKGYLLADRVIRPAMVKVAKN